ncbi:ATP-dependent zinc metalloprotease FtsH [Fodinicurvata sp. CAU 1616]|uniref:ATP-dependent zinc metalloprotease FtsH n=1 Tax=Aquibaculum arenosum TaxID=3032591 RepID=A0ABT5YMM3_9PROT|nr:ATP-dependent zinc metalloprotease FtsH [Fodinicurvata sp. CAU 1616]MDF2096208.1 ATP-dependent zinc metalloprotease FtsH [Fodinicurvata sp. CAU 1616]
MLILLSVMLLQSLLVESGTVRDMPYSEFEVLLEEGRLQDIEVAEDRITGTINPPLDGQERFTTRRVDPAIAEQLRDEGVVFRGAPGPSVLASIFSWLLPILVFFGIWLLLFRGILQRQGGGMGGFMSVGRSKAKVYMETGVKVSFDDVAGVDEAKAELQEIVEFLQNPERYGHLGARIPKGILLVGPPGTGKTLLARAVAGEAAVPFFSINGSEFVEMFVGVGAARVRDLFEQARKHAPAIIFIDELDALGRARGAFNPGGGHDEREQTLNQLLSELDGFDPREGVVLLSATNRPEILDPALLRAGRFDRQVLVDRPDKTGRAQILRVHMRKIRLAEDVDEEAIAGLTTGFTGADLANLVNEAALLATRRRAEAVTLADFTGAIERIVAGLEKRNRLLNPLERKVVAYHEMGHVLVALALPGSDKVHKVSIIPRGIGSLGYTIQRPTDERYLMTREELENKIAVLLGGRAAERLIFGHLSTGAADDLAKATDIARSMVTRYGMEQSLGHVAYDRERSSYLGQPGGQPGGLLDRSYSEATARQIDEAVRGIIDRVFGRTLSVLERNRALLERGAEALLQAETLDEAALSHLAEGLVRADDVAPGKPGPKA